MDSAQAEQIYESGRAAVIAKLLEFSSELETLKRIIVALEGRIQQLENQLAKDSHNSSKPPSSDGLNKQQRTKSQRHKTNRKVGGQKGHQGGTLSMVDNPDHIETCTLEQEYCICGQSLKGKKATGYERRQVIDIPSVKLEVTEYQAEIIDCACGIGHVAPFPDGVNAPVQYGVRLKSQIIYLMNYQFIPYDRLTELIKDCYGRRISLGTVFNYHKSCYHHLAATEQQIKSHIIQSKVVGFDESGASVNSKNLWLHSSSTDDYCYYACHDKRGKLAMDAIGILPQFTGTAVHDHWKSYFKFSCDHALCNSHHLRELQYISERYGQTWSGNMKKLLLEIKAAVDTAKELNGNCLANSVLETFENRYQQILFDGYEANPPPKVENKNRISTEAGRKRGRVKQSEPLNFLDRLKNYSKETLAFMYDFDVPFDNNLSERDIRMMKLRLKISGTFRSKFGADMFCRIRGFIATAKKQGINVLEAIEGIWAGNILLHV